MDSLIQDRRGTAGAKTGPVAQLAARVEGLPVLPAIAARLLQAVDDPDTSASDLADLINSDPALALRLLRLANSAYYGFPRHIGTVNLAVVILGTETVRDLCLSMLITDCLSQGVQRLPFGLNEFWKHSISAAVAGRLIYRTAGAPNPGEGFIAGLVHDVGKLFLARYFPDDYTEVIREVKSGQCSLLSAEEGVFQATHPQAAAWLLDSWNLPTWLVQAVRDHHGSHETPGRLAQTVTFADLLVRRAHFDGGSPGVDSTPDADTIALLRLKKDVYGVPDYSFYLEKLRRELQRAGDLAEMIRNS